MAALVALAVGVTCARPYALLMAPYYTAVDRLFTWGHPWTAGRVEIAQNDVGPGFVLKATSEVRRLPTDSEPAARTVTRLQVAEAIETPLVFWTVVLMWPGVSARQRCLRLGLAVPIYFGLEAMTTALQIIHALPAASAMLAGEKNPHTVLDRWSEFLEGGGRFALEIVAALSVIAMTAALIGRLPATPRHGPFGRFSRG